MIKVKSGRDTEYRMLHLWVEKMLGKPMKCSVCLTTKNNYFHWANISGEYKKDLSDWRRLCPKCHRKETFHRPRRRGKCSKGHILNEENTYAYPKGSKRFGCIECKTCRRIAHKISNPITNLKWRFKK